MTLRVTRLSKCKKKRASTLYILVHSDVARAFFLKHPVHLFMDAAYHKSRFCMWPEARSPKCGAKVLGVAHTPLQS